MVIYARKQRDLYVLLNYDHWDIPCDIARQTARAIARKGHIVYCVQCNASQSIFSFFRQFFLRNFCLSRMYAKNIFLFDPVLFPFSRRFAILQKLSLGISCIYLYVFTTCMYRQSQKFVWVLHPQLEYFVNFFFRYRIIYDIVDHFTSNSQEVALELERGKQALLRQSHVVVANSYTLKKLYQRFSSSPIHVVPQGFRLDIFRKRYKRMKRIKTIPPIIGFVGGINERLDVRLLHSLIKHNVKWHFMFVGPIEHDPNVSNPIFSDLFSKILSYSNVTVLSQQEASVIPSYINQFSICMIPYDISLDFNKYCYPMKLFEYFYMGKPIISTPIEELKRYAKYVMIGNGAMEWESLIRTTLEKPWLFKYKNQERQIAIKNSWEKKIEKILYLLQSIKQA